MRPLKCSHTPINRILRIILWILLSCPNPRFFVPCLPFAGEGITKKLKIPCQSGRRVLISARQTTRFSENNWRCEGQGHELRKEQTGWACCGDPCGSCLPFGLPVPRLRPTG